MYYSSNLMPNT